MQDSVPDRDAVLVLDHRPAHGSQMVREAMFRADLTPLLISKTASEFNVVEIFWSWFKRRWRQVVSDPEVDLNLENSKAHVVAALEASQSQVKSIVKGPIKYLAAHPPL